MLQKIEGTLKTGDCAYRSFNVYVESTIHDIGVLIKSVALNKAVGAMFDGAKLECDRVLGITDVEFLTRDQLHIRNKIGELGAFSRQSFPTRSVDLLTSILMHSRNLIISSIVDSIPTMLGDVSSVDKHVTLSMREGGGLFLVMDYENTKVNRRYLSMFSSASSVDINVIHDEECLQIEIPLCTNSELSGIMPSIVKTLECVPDLIKINKRNTSCTFLMSSCPSFRM